MHLAIRICGWLLHFTREEWLCSNWGAKVIVTPCQACSRPNSLQSCIPCTYTPHPGSGLSALQANHHVCRSPAKIRPILRWDWDCCVQLPSRKGYRQRIFCVLSLALIQIMQVNLTIDWACWACIENCVSTARQGNHGQSVCTVLEPLWPPGSEGELTEQVYGTREQLQQVEGWFGWCRLKPALQPCH